MDLLKEARKYGITDVDDLLREAIMRKEENITRKHKYKISQTKDGRWRTFLPDENGKKGREIRKQTRADLIAELVKFYDEDGITFKEAYEEWANYHHRKKNNSDNTRYKYQTDYNRFIKNTEIEERSIKSITDIEIDEYFIDTIYSNGHLTYKSFGRLYGYFEGTFKRALRLGYIIVNPMDRLEKRDYYETCKRRKYKSAKTELISNEDFDKLLERLRKDHVENPDYMPSYAVEFAALTGMRVGEIAALMWSDIDLEESVIIVQRSDKYNRITGTWEINDTTKTGKIREFPIDSVVYDFLKQLPKTSKWVFPDKDTWTHSNIISSCLKNKCKQIGLKRCYGIHAFRKTLNSDMRGNGASALICSGLLGNSIEVNNQYYTYDNTAMDLKREHLLAVHKNRKYKGFLDP